MNAAEQAKPSPGLLSAPFCYVIFICSGFAGLIYQGTWTRYLKSILGHEAYAQALVLGIFLGGIAVGAAIAGKYVARLRYPLLWYAIAEAVLAVAAVFFHELFVGVRSTLDGGLGASQLMRWLAGALLILPQSVLLGTTFPMLAAAVLRGREHSSGRVVAWLYCTNSLGGVLGILTVGIVLVKAVGLPGSMYGGAIASALAGLGAWWLHHQYPAAPLPKQVTATATQTKFDRGLLQIMLLVAFGTGLASLVYEVVWIRMLALILGSSTRSFELMVAAFILGLALGSFFVRTWPDRGDRLVTLAKVQLLMGTLAIASTFYYEQLYYLYLELRGFLTRDDAGFNLLGIHSFGLALLLMLGPTFCAGMTLPLLTRAALTAIGERALGSIYAWNTAGSIVGIALAVLLLLPWLGLKYALVVGAVVDLILGIILLAKVMPKRLPHGLVVAAGVLMAVLVLPNFNPAVLASGPYRDLAVNPEHEITFYQDGSTLSVAVRKSTKGTGVSLFSNGRGEGFVFYDAEETFTNSLFGETGAGAALGLLHHPQAKEVAVIGYGLGVVSEMLLLSDNIENLYSLEIEQAVLNASNFLPDYLTQRVFDDSRSHVIAVDAKAWLAARDAEPLDLILSIPSHPWVSGVSSLFTVEHFEQMQQSLAADGVLVQWMHLYESSPQVIATVVEALATVFPDYLVYMYGQNIFFVTSPSSERLQTITDTALAQLPKLATRLAKRSINSAADFNTLGFADQARFAPYIASFRQPPNSDYFPHLDHLAERAMFLKTNYALSQAPTRHADVFLSATLAGRNFREPFAPISSSTNFAPQAVLHFAVDLARTPGAIAPKIAEIIADKYPDDAAMNAMFAPTCAAPSDEAQLSAGLLKFMQLLTPVLYPGELKVVWDKMQQEFPCLPILQSSAKYNVLYDYLTALANAEHATVLATALDLLPNNLQATDNLSTRLLMHASLAAFQLGDYDQALELGYRLPINAAAIDKHAIRMIGAHALNKLSQ